MRYNKLVRDKIPAIIKKGGSTPVVRTADPDEYYRRLIDKLDEEVAEYKKETTDEELADIFEVICALAAFHGLSEKEFFGVRDKKREQRGGFEQKIILEETQ